MWGYIIFTAIILVITKWLQSQPFFWRGKGIPWKVPLPFLGNSARSLIESFTPFWVKFAEEIGEEPLCGFHFFTSPALLLKDPELIKKVTTENSANFQSREFHTNPKDDLLARSVFFTRQNEWKEQRTKMTPYFTPSRIKGMVQFLHPVTDRFAQYLEEEGKKGPVDVHSGTRKMSTDVIMTTVFGLKPDTFENPHSFFYHLQRELVNIGVSIRMMIGIFFPSLHDFLGLTILSSGTMKKLKHFTDGVMDQRAKGIGVRQDFMQGMMELMKKDDEEIGKKSTSAARFDRETVAGQCMIMYAAGTESVGNNLSFLLLELALNPDIQDRCRQEINDMIKRTSGQYSYEDLHNLTYVNMVLCESLRKYPPLPAIGRKCTKECELNGLKISAGTLMIIPILALQRDKKFFPNPDKFDPERFNPETPTTEIISGSYIPFGLGPRLCLGMRLGQTEMILALIKLLARCRVTCCDKTVIPVKLSDFSNHPTLSPRKPVLLNVNPI